MEAFPVVEVQQEAGKDLKMYCPKCKTVSLKKGKPKNSRLTIDYCSKCKGIWFDEMELEQIASKAIKDLSVPRGVAKSPRLCPKCRKHLYEFNYPQTYVIIDMCKKCKGLWLDAKELKEIQAIRKSLKASVKAEEYPEVTGIKGLLLDFVDSAIDNLLF